MEIANCRLRASLAFLVGTALFKRAMQILTVGMDRPAFLELVSLSARATLIATLGKSAVAVKLAEFAFNLPRVALAAVVAAAPPATTPRAPSAEQYDGAL